MESRLGLADAYRRLFEQGALDRSAMGVTVTASYQIEPRWTLSAGGGGSDSDVAGAATTAAYHFGVRSPARHPYTVGLGFASSALDATAALADRGVTTTGVTVDGRWTPGSGWRVDASAGRTTFEGTQANDRTRGFLAINRQLGRGLALGGSMRAFSFEQDLTEGYFDPDFYGIAEITGRWAHDVRAWGLLLEVAPGMQKVTSAGDPAAAFRGSARVAYRFAPVKEVSLAWGYSTAGLQSFAPGASDYRYTALVTGASWVF